MSAKKLTKTDWQYIINCIDEGYTQGEIQSMQDNKEILSGWWSLTDKGIIIKIDSNQPQSPINFLLSGIKEFREAVCFFYRNLLKNLSA